MIHALTMPAWGMEDAAGTVIAWLVEEGATVTSGQEIVEIETTKLTNVVESPFDGKLVRIVLGKGDGAPPGALLAVIVEGEHSQDEIEAFIEQNRYVETEAAPSEEPAESFIDVPGGRVRMMSLTGGSGVPALLLHGFGADWTNWSFLFRGLANSRPVYMLDLPGHGGSFKELGADPLATLVDAVVAAMNQIGPELHLVGHSLGGLVAAKAAAQAPGKVRSLALIAPAGFGSAVDEEFLELFANADSRRQARAAIERLVTDPDLVSLAMINDVIRARRIEGAKEALNSLREAMAAVGQQKIDIREEMKSLNVPVHVVKGGEDRIVEVDATGFALTELPGAGHLLHIEKASAVLQAIDQFMAG